MGQLIDKGTNTKISMGKEQTIEIGNSNIKIENTDVKKTTNEDYENTIFREEKTKNDEGSEIDKTIILNKGEENIDSEIAIAKKEIIDFEKRERDEMITRRKQDQVEK